LEEFKSHLRLHDPHIVLLSETHWKDEYKVKFSSYNSFTLNRASQGGGVAILIKKNLQATPLAVPSHVNLEAIGASVTLKNQLIIEVISVYCPNGNNCRYEVLENLLTNTGNSAIVGGDLNAHSDLWEDGYPTNTSGRNVKHYIQNEDKFILTTPKNLGTRPSLNDNRSATIDLTMCTPNLALDTTIVTGPYWGSDHLPVIIELKVNATPLLPPNPTWKFKENLWQEWNIVIDTIMKTAQSSNNAEECYNTFYDAMMCANNQLFAPKCQDSTREAQKPWWTKECKIATQHARKAYQLWRSTLLQSDKTHLNKLEAVKKRTILAAKNASWERHIDTLEVGNASKLWKFAKDMLNGRRESVNAPLNKHNGEYTSYPEEKANIFLEQFSPSNDSTTPPTNPD
jgi:exonuclease III